MAALDLDLSLARAADGDLKTLLEPVMRPVERAQGLPNAFYTDERLFKLEAERLFHRGWAGVAFAHDAPEPGDARPIDHLGAPLLLLRDKAGDIRVYENVCRHRGMILVAEPRKIEGAIRCPYHSWCYGLDGRLVSTPHVGGPGQNLHEAIDRDALGLKELPSRVWMGVVFVNVSGDAKPFEEEFGALMARWRAFDKPLTFAGADSAFTLDIATNWKLAVENYAESYHLPWVHPGLNAYSRLEDHYHIVEYGAFGGQGTLVYRPSLGADGKTFPDFENLEAKWDAGAEYLTAAPNVMLGVHRDHTFAILLEPLGVDRTREHVAIFYADARAAGDDFAELRAANAKLWKDVFVEDIFVVEGMQKGRSAPNFDGGRFSPAMDTPTHVFHDWAARRLLAAAR